MKNSLLPSIAWHYTTALGMAGINDTGCVSLATHGIGPNEKPVVWFSTNSSLEPTIREVTFARADGSYFRAKTIAEYRIAGLGLYRIALETSKLHRWVDLLKTAGISHTRRRDLERTAKKAGSLPYEWHGRVTPLRLTEAAGVDYYDGKVWCSLRLEQISQRLVIEQKTLTPLLERMIFGRRADAMPINSQTLGSEMRCLAEDRRAAARHQLVAESVTQNSLEGPDTIRDTPF